MRLATIVPYKRQLKAKNNLTKIDLQIFFASKLPKLQEVSTRSGYIIILQENDRLGLGEVAPLFGFSYETLAQARVQLQEQSEIWKQQEHIDYSKMYPSVAWGMSMAQLELTQKLPSEQLNTNFADHKCQSAYLCKQDITSFISKLCHDHAIRQKMALQAGDKPHPMVVKLKVGTDPLVDAQKVQKLLIALPMIQLRLDANGQWDLKDALQFSDALDLNIISKIQFFEEPCKTTSDSVQFSIQSKIPIAWDETVQHASRKDNFQISNLPAIAQTVKHIVIKPTLIGSATYCMQLIAQAKQLELKIIISSSLESSLGSQQLARFALWQCPDEIAGLDTQDIFIG